MMASNSLVPPGATALAARAHESSNIAVLLVGRLRGFNVSRAENLNENLLQPLRAKKKLDLFICADANITQEAADFLQPRADRMEILVDESPPENGFIRVSNCFEHFVNDNLHGYSHVVRVRPDQVWMGTPSPLLVEGGFGARARMYSGPLSLSNAQMSCWDSTKDSQELRCGSFARCSPPGQPAAGKNLSKTHGHDYVRPWCDKTEGLIQDAKTCGDECTVIDDQFFIAPREYARVAFRFGRDYKCNNVFMCPILSKWWSTEEVFTHYLVERNYVPLALVAAPACPVDKNGDAQYDCRMKGLWWNLSMWSNATGGPARDGQLLSKPAARHVARTHEKRDVKHIEAHEKGVDAHEKGVDADEQEEPLVAHEPQQPLDAAAAQEKMKRRLDIYQMAPRGGP
jgi:hypothetical protein